MNKLTLTGQIRSAYLCKPIPQTKISLLDKNHKVIKEFYSDENGQWKISEEYQAIFVRFSKEGYSDKTFKLKGHLPGLIRLLEHNIIGYTNKLSFQPGEKVNFFVNSPFKYSIDLIKHGLNNTVIKEFGEFEPTIQTVPDRFFVDTGLDWEITYDFSLPEKIESGFYSLKLSSNETNDKYFITFVIEPKNFDYRKKVLVLASTNNWQTYNIWGGRSRYRNFETPKSIKLIFNLKTLGLKYVPENIKVLAKKILRKHTIVTIKDHPDAFQFKRLSIKRPHPNCSINDDTVYSSFTSHLALGEWRVAAWLEREGFEYDVVSGYSIHNYPNILNNYKAIILNTHCEYWSKEMFSALKNFNEQGGSVLNLSGNSIYREVEFDNDGSLRCTSLRFADSVEDESKLIGVRFDMRGYGTCAPYKVLTPNHWVFEGTGIKKNQLFAKKSLNSSAGLSNRKFDEDPASSPGMAKLTGEGGSGWETDKITKTVLKDIILLAKGKNKRGGGADMIIREAPGKGLVFSASSITFGGTLLIDKISSKIIKNILNKIIS